MIDLVNGEGIADTGTLLLTGGAIWLTNVIAFRVVLGASTEAVRATAPTPPGSTRTSASRRCRTPSLAPADWSPPRRLPVPLVHNALAFSPTDVMPLSRWAKLTMLLQSLSRS